MNAVMNERILTEPSGIPVVREAGTDDASCWDAFVEHCPDATFFHRIGWKSVIERAFGHTTHFLMAERDGAIQGVLPLVQVRSLLFGNALISNGFCVYGGVAAISDAARTALLDAAVAMAEELGVDYLEMRNRQLVCPDWPRKDLYVTFRKEIDADSEVNLKAIPRKQRAVVRKGIKAGLQGVIDSSTDRFFSMYSASVRNLGTPVFAHKFFRILREVFGDACEILTIESDGRPVSSVMSFYFRDEVLPYYGGGTAEARSVRANDFMYWDLMCRAAERDIHWFDYGRSKQGTGSYRFKKNWGFEPEPLHYEFHLVKATELPDINPMNPKYRLFIQAWQKMPLALSQFLGPFVSRNLG
jgi:FemAB-related protein (PEP-CTERM system-associated)